MKLTIFQIIGQISGLIMCGALLLGLPYGILTLSLDWVLGAAVTFLIAGSVGVAMAREQKKLEEENNE